MRGEGNLSSQFFLNKAGSIDQAQSFLVKKAGKVVNLSVKDKREQLGCQAVA